MTVEREVFEETGIRVCLLPPAHSFAFEEDEVLHSPYVVLRETIDFPPEPLHLHVDLVYLCRAVLGDDQKLPSPNLAEVLDARFVGAAELGDLEMMVDVRQLLKSVFRDANAWSLLERERKQTASGH